MKYKRILNTSSSFNYFLFGARGTGKTTYLQMKYNQEESYWFDLLDIELEDRLAKNPKLIIDILSSLESKIKYIIFDEIQKLPRLLDLIHQYIQKNQDRFIFILTGSSARKLKKGGANLLAGRAFVNYLYPLTYKELNNNFNLNHYLKFGGLPQLYLFQSPQEKEQFLRAYGLTYLKEEVWAEHLIKKLNPFRNFIELAALENGKIINYSKIARQIGVDTKTIQTYFDILIETHMGFLLESYHSSVRKRIIQAPKFYLFDTGVKRALDNTLTVELLPQTYAFGRVFEHFIICQLHFLSHYFNKDFRFFYLKTKDGIEIDLIIKRPDQKLIIIEIKSSTQIDTLKLNSLKHIINDLNPIATYCLSLDPIKQKKDNITYCFWKEGLEEILDLN